MSNTSTRCRARAICRQAAVSIVALLVTLPLLEGALRLVKPQDPDFYNSEKFLRSGKLIPNTAGNYTGVPVRINSIGFRDREVEIPKPPGTFRVLAIGDSVTFGFGVRLEESYPKRLEARLNAGRTQAKTRVEVLNAAIPGTGLVSYLETLETKGPLLQPDLVVVGVIMNDIMDYDAVGSPHPRRQSRLADGLHELNRALLLHSHLYLLSYMNLKSVLIQVGAFDINTAYHFDFLPVQPPSERQERAWTSTLRVLDRLVRTSQDLTVPLVLVVFPIAVQLDKPTLDLYRRALRLRLDESPLNGIPQQRLAEFARTRNIPLIDLLPPFRESHSQALFLRNRSVSYDWVHLSPAGHELAADVLFSALQTLELVPRSGRHARQPAHAFPAPPDPKPGALPSRSSTIRTVKREGRC